MNGRDIEFLAESQIVTVLPSISMESIELLSVGTIGPFEAGIPIKVPLFAAIVMKRLNRCIILTPDWMMAFNIKSFLEAEQTVHLSLTETPNQFFGPVSKILLQRAPFDMNHANIVNYQIEEILDVRNDKTCRNLRVHLDSMNKVEIPLIDLGYSTAFEVLQHREVINKQAEMIFKLKSATRKS
ncbi:hypothetical protein ACOME3_006074 [Neoechinorhynchus agilis]